MKVLAFLLVVSVLPLLAQYPEWYEGGAPQYLSESPLPKDWPEPGPYFRVTQKTLPLHKLARTEGSSSTLTFLRLLRFIKKQGIEMTAPVMMTMKEVEGERIKKQSTTFVFRTPEVSVSSAKSSVTVSEQGLQKVLCYTWQGCDCEKKQKYAKQALQNYALLNGLQLKTITLLGYNSPGIPDDQQTWELIASY